MNNPAWKYHAFIFKNELENVLKSFALLWEKILF